MSHSSEKLPRGIIFKLAWADLRHEWILSLCLIMAVTAVLGPLLILMGLKYGSIEILQSRLIKDPRNSEIRPITSRVFNRSWFEEIQGRDDVQFVMPMTRKISTAVDICLGDSKLKKCAEKLAVDLLPTDENDPLLLKNNGSIPSEDECVLTARAAEKSGAKPGDELLFAVRRIVNNKYELANLQLKVKAVLDSRAGSTEAVYVRLTVLEAVEQFKDGAAVTRYGWPGKQRGAYPLYDGLILFLPDQLNEVDQLLLKNNSGFYSISQIDSEELSALASFTIGMQGYLYFLRVRKNPVGIEAIKTIKERLRGKKAVTIPWVKPLSADFLSDSGEKISFNLTSVGYSKRVAEKLQLTPQFDLDSQSSAETKMPQLIGFIEGQTESDSQMSGMLTVHSDGRELQLPLTIKGELADSDRLHLPANLAGIFRLLDRRQVSYDSESNLFLLSRKGYAGFRLYASSLDKVDSLRLFFEKKGVKVVTQADRIRDVQELNHYLTIIFWLIGATAMVGGTATLAASLYASVERKSRDIAVLRLIGFSKKSLLRFPFYQGFVLSFSGLLVALAFFAGSASLINHLFITKLKSGECLCILYPEQILFFSLLLFAITVVSSLVAAERITSLEPVDGLRDE